ncbi:response regulator transcription factor [Pedobacter sp. AW1-32]|uniref:response regulator transcription factor n=1 Tax=Pedobacter sp. AW1-32 TaxID=3383026 RepID=UPI003FEF4902
MANTVFVLEDNDEIREVIQMVLEEEQLEIQTFPNVSVFLAALETSVPNLFLLDVMLPDGNGIDVCTRLKADTKTAHVPVIMMTANSNVEKMKAAANAEDFIAKPFDIYDLAERVHKQLKTTA